MAKTVIKSIIMQLTTVFFTLGSFSLAAAAPKPLVAERDVYDNLLVTFWKDGCYDTASGTSSTFVISK
jgi:hypothetical protein